MSGAGGGEPVMECRICWYRYEPEAGDPFWQIAPGTPFAALPEHWCCPECDAPRDRFLVATLPS